MENAEIRTRPDYRTWACRDPRKQEEGRWLFVRPDGKGSTPQARIWPPMNATPAVIGACGAHTEVQQLCRSLSLQRAKKSLRNLMMRALWVQQDVRNLPPLGMYL